MKKRKVIDRIRLGIFVLGALILITALIFYVGSNQQKFGSKKEVKAVFKNVSGLKTGNLVRLAGVTIGTVDAIEIVSDSTIIVTILVDSDAGRFIKKDSRAYIKSEGLLGTKYISLSSGSPEAGSIDNGDQIAGTEALDIDIMLDVFNETGNNAKKITENLNNITKKIDMGEGTLGGLISDRGLLTNMEKTIYSFERIGTKTNILTTRMGEVTNNMIVITDTLKAAGSNTVKASENFVKFTDKLNNDSSTLGKFISDTSMAGQIDETFAKVTRAAEDIEMTSCRVRNHWFMRLFGKNNEEK